MQSAAITGNLTKDPQVTDTEKGTVVRFAVASSPRYRDRHGQWQASETVFARVEWWGARAAAFARHARQGTAVVAVGEWRAQTWTTEAGEKARRQYVAAEAVGIVTAAAPDPDKATAERDGEVTPRSQPAKQAAEKATESKATDDFWGEDE